MASCLCCVMKMPASQGRVCPKCGHAFQGRGWRGTSAHWRARHETEMSYEAFRKDLCLVHGGASGPSAQRRRGEDYAQALVRRSRHIEQALIHPLTAKVAMELWRRDPWLDLDIFRAEVDEAGFDLVLGCKGTVRYIQVREAPVLSEAGAFSLRKDLAGMPGACAVGLINAGGAVDTERALFFGGGPGELMPSLDAFPRTRSLGRRSTDRAGRSWDHRRDVAQALFQGPLSIGGLVDRLFPDLPGRP